MKKITVKNNKIVKHNFQGKLLNVARKNLDALEDRKYEVINMKNYVNFRKI